MKNLLLVLTLGFVLLSSATTFATESVRGGYGIGQFDSSGDASTDYYVPVAVCYSQYRGIYGYGNYYGYDDRPRTVINNREEPGTWRFVTLANQQH